MVHIKEQIIEKNVQQIFSDILIISYLFNVTFNPKYNIRFINFLPVQCKNYIFKLSFALVFRIFHIYKFAGTYLDIIEGSKLQ